ncbi:hypothetical protein B0H34DRAFT_736999 [Crassisporium funariophilum]|nr:hypothetical protein B0H34DRAFT_736999 [Crassisporium funariophilum]
MSKSQHLLNPELEIRPAIFDNEVAETHSTLLDLLEIYPHKVVCNPELDHDLLMRHFQTEDVGHPEFRSRPQPLRIFFVQDLNFPAVIDYLGSQSETNTTAHWLRQRFNVTPLFFTCLISHKYFAKTGNACFTRRDKDGKCIALGAVLLAVHESASERLLDGLYRSSSGFNEQPAHIWFSHSLLKDQHSTYIIHQCSADAKRHILACAQGNNFSSLLRPLAIDGFLAEDALHGWGNELLAPRNSLISYENSSIAAFSSAASAKAVEHLHSLSQTLHIISEDVSDLRDRLEYLHKVSIRLSELSVFQNAWHGESVAESFEFLSSRASILSRWAFNYVERTGIRINLFMGLLAQGDSRVSLDIARLTGKISVATQKDSSSMITMAAVTMFFLPGTFVSALFSMVFFNTQPDDAGHPLLVVGPQWWLFPTITIPLTVFVFIIWIFWQRLRAKESENLDVAGLTDPPEPSEKSVFPSRSQYSLSRTSLSF